MRILIRNRGSESWKPIEPLKAPEIELQKLLVDSPEILPFEDLEVSFVIMIPEFSLSSGAADILAFSADGDIAIIECKRADNPDVKRKVIGQIIEYASYLWGMSYGEVDEHIRQKEGKSLVELVRERAKGDWDEDNFRKGVEDSLEKGKFSLIIAVDEINEELKRTIQYLNECGSPAYSIYALEMRRFKQDDIEIMIPHLYPELKVALQPPPSWSWEKFRQVIEKDLEPAVVDAIEQLYDWAENEELIKIVFGRGKIGSMLFYLRSVSPSVFSITTNGKLWLNYGWLSRVVDENIMREFHKLHGIKVSDDFSRFPSIKVTDAFVSKPEMVEKFKKAVIWLANKIHSSATKESS